MSYTPLKTINGASIKGTGNLVVSGGGVSDGDYGDITVSSSGTVWNIDAATVGVTELSATGTPSATTFLRGDNTWATPPNPEGWTTIVKSANQDVTNSATLVDDTDLQFSVVAGGHYMVELQITYSGNGTTADYKYSIAVSSGSMKGAGSTIYTSAAGGPANSLMSANIATKINDISCGVIYTDLNQLHTITALYSFTASANATCKYQFAQNTAIAATTARTWKGSILKYKRLD